ncbi:cytidylate kinase family protein [Candidatus Woesearchaeota archaeon]|nr:cytidylate kinase family protein [Candidatus Woesearchaeota archaeon]
MNITISGSPGSGKSTVADIVASKLGFRRESIGDLMRSLASMKGVSLLEISRLAESDRSIDLELDSMQRELGRKDSLVVDSRLGFHFIPGSFKVFLDVSPDEAGRRIFEAKRRVERENSTLKDTVLNTARRKESELRRYAEFYGLNPFDMSNYDLVIDTTSLSPEEVAAAIVSAFRRRQGGKN